MDRIVLSYSGGLATSVAIAWLTETYHAEVVAVTFDVGQGKELDDVRERALAIGAARAHVLDLRDEFAKDFVIKALQARAIYEGRYPLATALGRPLIAKHLVEIARIEGATAIAHGCSGSGHDAIRLDVSIDALNPDLAILAPAREWDFTPAAMREYARERGLPVPAVIDRAYRIDRNLWGRSIDCGVIEDVRREPPDDIYFLTKSPVEAPDVPAYVDIAFERGVPITINGIALSPVELISSLEAIAGAHGVGRIDMVENDRAGIKSREIYEAPAAVALHTAHRELHQLVTPRNLERLTQDLGVRYADLVYRGKWYTPMREAIDALVAKVEETVTGTIRLKFWKGDCRVVGRESQHALKERAGDVGFDERAMLD
jgi:argininosuccinate synthase